MSVIMTLMISFTSTSSLLVLFAPPPPPTSSSPSIRSSRESWRARFCSPPTGAPKWRFSAGVAAARG
eukprot:5594075-Pyramimonas_sp.AAC.1